jgi:hypothetical protein
VIPHRHGRTVDYLADATVRRTAMTGIELFHVGVLVKDLDETVARFSDLLQLSFEPPRTMEVVDIPTPLALCDDLRLGGAGPVPARRVGPNRF